MHDAASCREWIASLSVQKHDRLSLLHGLISELPDSALPWQAQLEIAELARTAYLAAVDAQIRALDLRAFPLGDSDRQQVLSMTGGLRAAARVFEYLHEAQGGDALLVADPADPRTGQQILAFARGLDCRARAVIALQRCRIEVQAPDWDELCLLAHRARSFRMSDVRVSDPMSSRGSVSCRELFIAPLLVRLAEPACLNPAEFEFSAKLARRWAGRVGYRIGDGRGTQETCSGPTLSLSSLSSVRLVTNGLRDRMQVRLQQLAELEVSEEARLPGGMTVASGSRLLNDLLHRWCEPRSVIDEPASELGRLKVCFGFPSFSMLAGHSAQALTEPGRKRGHSSAGTASWHAVAQRTYSYGQFEVDSLMRRAYRAERVDPLQNWVADGWVAQLVTSQAGRAVLVGNFCAASIVDGGLTLMQLEAPDSPAFQGDDANSPARRVLGRVRGFSQRVDTAAAALGAHRVIIEVWAGKPDLVGLRSTKSADFEDVLSLKSRQQDEPESLVMPRGLYRQGDEAVLREHETDCRIRFESVIESGPDYDRVCFTRIGF